MSVNSLFQPSSDEQGLYESLITEAIQIYGHDFKYVPREVVKEDKLLGEDVKSAFTDTYDIEMYVENIEGYDGQDLFQKFGVEIRDESTFVVVKSRWNTVVGTPASLTRPREGDLVYFELSKALFEITFVEHEEPFYQLNNLPVYKLRVSLFEYNGEDLDIDGVDTTGIEALDAMVLTLDATGAYTVGETLTQVQTTGTVTGEVVESDGTRLVVAHASSDSAELNMFEAGFDVVGTTSGLTRGVDAVTIEDEPYGTNNLIEAEADDIIDFSESNPFGDF